MKSIKNSLLIIFISFCLISCSKWLDVIPADRIVEEQVFDSQTGFYSALNGVYLDLLNSNLYGASLGPEFIEILAQQYNIRPANVDFTTAINQQYTNDFPKRKLQGIWNASYRSILNCNKILENVANKSALLQPDAAAIIKGESLALRAFLHFDLFRLFGPVYKTNPENLSIPYMEKVGVSVSSLLPANQLVEKVLNDLTQAEQLLLSADPIIQNGPLNSVVEGLNNEGRYRTLRFNYYAVLALKARVYMYSGDKINALKYAKIVIDAPDMGTHFPFITHTQVLGNSKNPDLTFSTEVLFGLLNTSRNNLFTSYFNPDATVNNLLIPRPGTVTALFAGEESDYRNFPIWKISPLEPNAVYNTKYKAGEDLTLFRNNLMPLIRLGEMYLIAAESETNTPEAYNYLNVLRNKRGLIAVSDGLLTRISNEYKKEFFGEGQLFFYYKRNFTTPLKSGITGNNITMTIARYVPLLPDSEIQYRP